MAIKSVATEKFSAHCERGWPFDIHSDHIDASLRQAVYGASTLADMLLRDDNIRWEHENSPGRCPPPFSPNTRSGLSHALAVCLDTCLRMMEFKEGNEIGRAA